MAEQKLGCIIEGKNPSDYPYEVISGGVVDIPKKFIVDSPHLYQNGIDACVGMAVAGAKSTQENVKLSPRFTWHLSKKMDSYLGWGTTISKCLKGLKDTGTILYGAIDESVSIPREKYMRPDIKEDLLLSAKKYRIDSYWRAGYGAENIQATKAALFEQNVPLITSMVWYEEYNIPNNGFLPKNKSLYGQGHCFLFSGWDVDLNEREYLIFKNSFQNNWGAAGSFFIYTDELASYNMGNFIAITDIPSDKAKVLTKYNGKLVRNAENPAHYFVGGGQIAWIQNEQKFHFGTNNKFWGKFSDTIIVEEDLTELYDFIF